MRAAESDDRRTCRRCGRQQAELVGVLERVGLPPSEDGHMITYSHLVARRCGACGAREIEWLDHDCFDYEEVWDQYEWYLIASDAMERLGSFLSRCPAPLEASCGCAIHEALRASCRELPRRGWRTSLEAEEHVHRVRIDRRNGLPWLLAGGAS